MAAAFNLGKFPGFRGHDLPRRVQGRERPAQGQHGAGRRDPGRPGPGRRAQGQQHRRRDLRRRQRGRVRQGQPAPRSRCSACSARSTSSCSPPGPVSSSADDVIPVDRTQSAYDIVGVFSDLTTTTERIDTDQLSQALDVVADTTNKAAPEIEQSFRGIARLSQSVASRDEQIQALLKGSQSVSKVLAARSEDLVSLMKNSDLVFQEVQRRKEAVHLLLVNARDLATELRGVAADNKAQMAPGAPGGRRPALAAELQGEGAEGDARRARALRRHPQQHHRHRPVVRRLRLQPPRHPDRRVRARPGWRTEWLPHRRSTRSPAGSWRASWRSCWSSGIYVLRGPRRDRRPRR